MITAYSIARIVLLLTALLFFFGISSIARAQEGVVPPPNNLPGENITPGNPENPVAPTDQRPTISWWWLLPLLLIPILFFLPSKREDSEKATSSEYAYHDIDDDLELEEEDISDKLSQKPEK